MEYMCVSIYVLNGVGAEDGLVDVVLFMVDRPSPVDVSVSVC